MKLLPDAIQEYLQSLRHLDIQPFQEDSPESQLLEKLTDVTKYEPPHVFGIGIGLFNDRVDNRFKIANLYLSNQTILGLGGLCGAFTMEGRSKLKTLDEISDYWTSIKESLKKGTLDSNLLTETKDHPFYVELGNSDKHVLILYPEYPKMPTSKEK
ncbi:hypothetical protein GOV12_08325 [Candidatus Pacearchaeota archaeon]|nr:hypothetical protein [Candidatus Pacearchaeota archaeon]